jgi:hypothetical protein
MTLTNGRTKGGFVCRRPPAPHPSGNKPGTGWFEPDAECRRRCGRRPVTEVPRERGEEIVTPDAPGPEIDERVAGLIPLDVFRKELDPNRVERSALTLPFLEGLTDDLDVLLRNQSPLKAKRLLLLMAGAEHAALRASPMARRRTAPANFISRG